MKSMLAVVLLALCSTAPAAEYIQVTKNKVRIRTAPTTEAEIIGTANKGDVFEVHERSGQWVGILMFSGEGRYIHSSLVGPIDELPALPDADTRKQACIELARVQNQAIAEALEQFASHFDRMIDHERLLTDRMELPIFQRYGIAPARNSELLIECVTKKWR